MNSNHIEEVGTDEQKRVNSAVQARIEAMFASVEAESGTPGECAAAILPVNIYQLLSSLFFPALRVTEHVHCLSRQCRTAMR